jgi:hypothetical protein
MWPWDGPGSPWMEINTPISSQSSPADGEGNTEKQAGSQDATGAGPILIWRTQTVAGQRASLLLLT